MSEIENSFFKILKASFGEISPKASERITTVDDCEPTFPPVDISIGTNAVSIIDCARTFSYPCIMFPDIVSDIISTASHPILCFATVNTFVFK